MDMVTWRRRRRRRALVTFELFQARRSSKKDCRGAFYCCYWA